MAPNGAKQVADILGTTDLDFENSHVFVFVASKFLDVQVPRFPKSGLGRAWAGPGLGWARASFSKSIATKRPGPGPGSVQVLDQGQDQDFS